MPPAALSASCSLTSLLVLLEKAQAPPLPPSVNLREDAPVAFFVVLFVDHGPRGAALGAGEAPHEARHLALVVHVAVPLLLVRSRRRRRVGPAAAVGLKRHEHVGGAKGPGRLAGRQRLAGPAPLLPRPGAEQGAPSDPDHPQALGDQTPPPRHGRDVVQHGDAEAGVEAARAVGEGQRVGREGLEAPVLADSDEGHRVVGADPDASLAKYTARASTLTTRCSAGRPAAGGQVLSVAAARVAHQ